MIVKVKKLHPNAVLPSYAMGGDAGMDLTALENGNESKGYLEYRTGISMEIPQGYVGLIFPRSSISTRNLVLSNSVGVIDSGYRGEITFRFYRGKEQFSATYMAGDRIGQILIIPYPQVTLIETTSDLSTSQRGTQGYGSSGK